LIHFYKRGFIQYEKLLREINRKSIKDDLETVVETTETYFWF